MHDLPPLSEALPGISGTVITSGIYFALRVTVAGTMCLEEYAKSEKPEDGYSK